MMSKLRALLLVAILAAAAGGMPVDAQDAPTRIFVHPVYGFSVEFDWSWEAIPLSPFFGSGGLELISGRRRIEIQAFATQSIEPKSCINTYADTMRGLDWMASLTDAHQDKVTDLEAVRPASAFAIYDAVQTNGWTGTYIVECRFFENSLGMAIFVYKSPGTDIDAEIAAARSVFDTARSYVPWATDFDLTPESMRTGLLQELDAANAYWERTFAELGWGAYVPPAGLEVFESGGSSRCGAYAATESSHYCPGDTVIRVSYTLTIASMGMYGELDAHFLIGHEMGHHIQNLRNVPLCGTTTCRPNEVGNPEAEYQASCLLGAYMGGSGLVGANDEWLLTTTGQSFFYMQEEPIHGDGAENARWFLVGALDGPEACFVFPLSAD